MAIAEPVRFFAVGVAERAVCGQAGFRRQFSGTGVFAVLKLQF
jgi:hypothetical protein